MPQTLNSAFIHERLNYVRRETIQRPLPEYLAANGNVANISTEIPRGARSYTYYILNMVGEAKIIANPADDLPTADVYTEARTGIIHDVGVSYRYTDADLEAAAYAGVELTTQKALAAKTAAMVKLDKIGYMGDSQYGLLGLLNQPNVPFVSLVADGVGGSTAWQDKTPTQVIRDLRDISTVIPVETNMVEKPDTLLLPPTQYYYLTQTYKDPSSNMTLMRAFLETQGIDGIVNVERVPYLAGMGIGGVDLAIVYKRREDKVKFHVPVAWYPKEPQPYNFAYNVPCRLTTGGIEMPFRMSARYIQGL